MDCSQRLDLISLDKRLCMHWKVSIPVLACGGGLMEGSIAVAGSAVKWARDQLGIIKTANEIGELASKVEGSLPHLLMIDLEIRLALSL
jgi:hypothetical protein